MSSKLIQVVACSFCARGGGAITIDSTKIKFERTRRMSGDLDIALDTQQQIINFDPNKNKLEPRPCEHLLILRGDFGEDSLNSGGNMRFDWSRYFFWFNEVLRHKRTRDNIQDFLDWVDDDERTPSDLLPNTPRFTEWFNRRWQDTRQPAGNKTFYTVEGHAIFAADVKSFCDEVLGLIPKHQAWLNQQKSEIVEYEDEEYEYVEVPVPGEIKSHPLRERIPKRKRIGTSRPNRRRAERAAKTLVASGYKDDGLGWDSAVADLITDFLHLADSRGFDFDGAFGTSETYYTIECEEDV